MDGTALIKEEDNNFEISWSGDTSPSSSASGSPQTSLHQPEDKPLKIETTTGRVVKIKQEQSLEGEPLLNHEKTTSQQQLPTVQAPSEYRCELCLADGKKLKLYANKRALRVHMDKVHRLTPRFKCDVCFKQFNCSSNFKRHSRGHLYKSFKCEVCSLPLQNKLALNLHLVREHDYDRKKLNAREFPCDLCTNIYSSKFNLEQHVVKTHVVDKPLECHVCSKTFIDQEALSNHLKSHDKQSCHACDVCSRAFVKKRNLLHHLGVEHHQFFRCDKCKKSFSNKLEFDAHSDIQQQIQNTCQICNNTFPSQCTLSVHIEFHNSAESQNQESSVLVKDTKFENARQKFKCELCLKTFRREAFIVAHRKLVHPRSQWPCSKCPKIFDTYGKMREHELTHEEVKPYACKFCDKSYCNAYELKVHENNTHSSTKHFKCQLCPESFANSTTLKSHKANYHGGEKPFKCHLCSTSWVTEGYLNNHLISHRTEKLFPCESCSKSFKDLKQLKTHVRIVHDKHAAKKLRNVTITRHSESLVFLCNLCSFETQEDKEVAVHYNSHGLPKITLFRHPRTSASVKPTNSSQPTKLGEKIKLVRCIEKRSKCSTCSKLFNSPKRLQDHSYSHSKRNLKACSKCPASFTTNFNLTRHLLNVHRRAKEKKYPDKSDDEV